MITYRVTGTSITGTSILIIITIIIIMTNASAKG
jgi:hypothetical protein